MTGRELIRRLEEAYPAGFAESWDNPGLQAGGRDKEVKRVFVALDATDEIIEEAVQAGADMILTHHPLLMSGVKRVDSEDFIGRRLIKIIQNEMLCYAIHTNYDVLTMADLSARYLGLVKPSVLEVTWRGERDGAVREEGIGRVGPLDMPMTLEELGRHVKRVFGLDTVKIFGDARRLIERAAISPGSGKSMIGAAIDREAQVLITGDIGHHDGLDAVARGVSVIDAGHYGLEHIFINQMAEYLKREIPGLDICRETIKNPFFVI